MNHVIVGCGLYQLAEGSFSSGYFVSVKSRRFREHLSNFEFSKKPLYGVVT
jgi:hypothetical protein